MSQPAKNSIYRVTIEGYTSQGQGVARIDGRAVFVKGAIRGEVCDIRILKVTEKLMWAKIERMLEPSPHRLSPACPVFSKCGGCSLMHMDYSEELRFKLDKVQADIRRIAGLDLTVDGITGAESVYNYRNKAIYAIGSDKSGIISGFYRERSHDICPVDECLIQHQSADRALKAVRRWMTKSGATPYDEGTRTGLVRHVFCRCSHTDGTAQVTLICTDNNLPKRGLLIELIRSACPETASIVLNINKSPGNTVLSGEFVTLWGADAIEDELCGLRFKLSPASFFQVNPRQAELLYGKALEFAGLEPDETALDLYCGTGTITLCMARHCREAIGAEVVESAVHDAEENARQNGIDNARFILSDAGEAARRLRLSGGKIDLVLVDPPRKGLSPDVPGIIADIGPKRVVYVSCDPATLSRDLKLFSQLGYTAERVHAVDMFPRTWHVECVALLKRD